MFRTFRLIAGALLLAVVASCGPSKIKTYNGPPVTQIVVNKNARQMFFFSGPSVIAAYNIGNRAVSLDWASPTTLMVAREAPEARELGVRDEAEQLLLDRLGRAS